MLRFEYRKGKGIAIYKGTNDNFKEIYYFSVKDGIVTLLKLVLLLVIVIVIIRYLKGI